jgi:AcrR family transcriptional regulator
MTELSRREKQREATLTEIKDVARRQMAEAGAAALSLRAIAREMGLSAPALYRYYDSRDALVTELIIDAYNALAGAMMTADAAQKQTAYASRLRAVGEAYHRWAVAHPEDYKLIYGTPIPGYHAPRVRTVEPAGNVQQAIGIVLAEAAWADRITFPDLYTQLPPGLEVHINNLLPVLPDNVPPQAVIGAIVIWYRWHGLVWGEIAGHFPPGLADSGELFDMEMTELVDRLAVENREQKTENRITEN